MDSWRDWGGSFWGDEEVDNGEGDKDGGHGSGEKGKSEYNKKAIYCISNFFLHLLYLIKIV